MNPFNVDHSRFYRDSRSAFGHRFQVDRPSRDWMFAVAGFTAACLFIVVMAGQL